MTHDIRLDHSLEDLHRRFYHSSPADYFQQRLTNLILVYVEPERFQMESELKLTLGGHPFHVATSPHDPKEQNQRYVATESELILHHISETVLRLYLAHRPSAQNKFSGFPWYEIAKLRNFSKFKKLVQQEIVKSTNDERRRELLTVTFFGGSKPDHFSPRVDDETWEEAVSTLDQLVSILADKFLNHAHLYNAAKHGLAINAGDATVELSDETDGVLFHTKGMAIGYLEEATIEKGKTQWQETTEWVDVEHAMVLSSLACTLIRSLWSVARRRFLGEEKLELAVHNLANVSQYGDLRKPNRDAAEGIYVQKMSIPLSLSVRPR